MRGGGGGGGNYDLDLATIARTKILKLPTERAPCTLGGRKVSLPVGLHICYSQLSSSSSRVLVVKSVK